MFEDQSHPFLLNHAIWNHIPKNFDLQQPTSILPYAQYRDTFRLNFGHTMSVIDVRGLHRAIKTIVLDAERGIFVTPKSTQFLINALKHHLNYEIQQIITMAAERAECSRTRLPVIQNQLILCPLGAATRSATSWFSLHGLSGYQREGNRVKLEYADQLSLTIPKSVRAFEAQHNKAYAIQRAVQTMLYPPEDPLTPNSAPNLALNPKVQAGLYTTCGLYLLRQFGIEATREDVEFYQRQFFW